MKARVETLSDAALNEMQTAVDEQLSWGVAGRFGVQFLRPLEAPAPIDTTPRAGLC